MSIEISKMIAHKLQINKPLPKLSDKCIDLKDLENNKDALDFFTTHIENSRGQGFVKKCQFDYLENNTVKNSIESIISEIDDATIFEQSFIDESKSMALKLAKNMKSTSTKSDGSLFVLLYSVDGKNHIGLLKMDPDIGVEVQDDLSIVVRQGMLPSKKEKLHKSAFIICQDEFKSNELHLFVLDRQQGSKDPAQYFLKNFLNARELPDNKNLTIAYQREIVNEFRDILPEDIFMNFNQKFKKRLMTGKKFVLDVDFPVLLREVLPQDQEDGDFDFYIRTISKNLVKKFPGEVTSFTPVIASINDTIYQTLDKDIEIKISQDADKDMYNLVKDNNGNRVLTVYKEAGWKTIK